MIIIQKSTEPSHKYIVNFPTFDEIDSNVANIVIEVTEDTTDIIQATEETLDRIICDEYGHSSYASQINGRRKGTQNLIMINAKVNHATTTSANIEFELPEDIIDGEYEVTISDMHDVKGKTLLRIEKQYNRHKQNNIDRIIKE